MASRVSAKSCVIWVGLSARTSSWNTAGARNGTITSKSWRKTWSGSRLTSSAPRSVYVEAAKRATSTIPIIFAVHADPIGSGHVASLARPGASTDCGIVNPSAVEAIVWLRDHAGIIDDRDEAQAAVDVWAESAHGGRRPSEPRA